MTLMFKLLQENSAPNIAVFLLIMPYLSSFYRILAILFFLFDKVVGTVGLMSEWLKIVIAFLYKSFSRVIISHFFYQKCGIIQNLTPITKGYGIPKLAPSLHFKAILIDSEYTDSVRTVKKSGH